MKRLLIIAVIILANTINGYSQKQYPIDSVTGKVTFQKIFTDSMMSAQDFFLLFSNYTKTNRQDFLITNDFFPRERAFSRVKWGNRQDVKIGHILDYPEEKKILGHCIFAFGGGGWQCVEFLILRGDVYITCKDKKSKMTITNLRYEHYSGSGIPKMLSIKSHKDRMPETGTLEDLIKFQLCENTVNEVDSFYQECPKYLYRSFKEFKKSGKAAFKDDF